MQANRLRLRQRELLRRSYLHFCACGRQLDVRLGELGASPFVGRRDVNKEDWQAVDAWLQAVVNGLSLLKLQTVAESGGECWLAAPVPRVAVSSFSNRGQRKGN